MGPVASAFEDRYSNGDATNSDRRAITGATVMPTGTITLSQICSGYNIPNTMSALNGRIYYDTGGTLRIIKCSNDNAFNMGALRGMYLSLSFEYYYDSPESVGYRHSSTGRNGGGVEAKTKISNVTVAKAGSKIIYATYTLNYTASNYGGSLNAGLSFTECTIILSDNTRIGRPSSDGTYTVDINSQPPVRIEAKSRARNNWPGGESGDALTIFTLV